MKLYSIEDQIIYSDDSPTIKETVVNAVEKGASLFGVRLISANLVGARLIGAMLIGANLTRANLTRANLTGARLIGANLTQANLAQAIVSYTNLTEANLTRASLIGADLTRANLTRASLTDINLSYANLSYAMFLETRIRDDTLIDTRQITNIGSRRDTLIFFICKNNIYARTGCFFGTLQDFEKKVNLVHGDNKYGIQYKKAIQFIKDISL